MPGTYTADIVCYQKVCRQLLLTYAHVLTLTLILFALTFGVALPIICNDWIYSNYYLSTISKSELEKEAMAVNLHYMTEAKKILSYLKSNYEENESFSNKENVDLVIGIITVPRRNIAQEVGYLTQTVAQLLQILHSNRRNFDTKVLFVCNVFAGPGNHTEAQALREFTHIIDRYPRNNPTAVIMDRFDKEKNDYAYCLNASLEFKPRYVLLIEDDTLPRMDVLDILEVVVHNRLENMWIDGYLLPQFEEWSFLKLYYPERWKGYGLEIIPLTELAGIGMIGGSMFMAIKFAYEPKMNKLSMCLCFMLGFLYTILVALMVGRQYLIEWRRISKHTYTVVPAPNCCSPAILYRADKARQLSTFLRTQKCSASFPVDYAIDKFSEIYGYQKYLIEPNIMQHIGMLSSIKTWSDRPQEFINRI